METHLWFLLCPHCDNETLATDEVEDGQPAPRMVANCRMCESDFVLWTKIAVDSPRHDIRFIDIRTAEDIANDTPFDQRNTPAQRFQRKIATEWYR
jgi:hypothetical protein